MASIINPDSLLTSIYFCIASRQAVSASCLLLDNPMLTYVFLFHG
jgi:hypothetical protein